MRMLLRVQVFGTSLPADGDVGCDKLAWYCFANMLVGDNGREEEG